MSYTMSKDKNIISFLNNEKTTPYTFDVNTGIFYGLSKKPIKNYPPYFKSWVARNYTMSNVVCLLEMCMEYTRTITGDWETINAGDLTSYAKLFKIADKLDSINYNNVSIHYNREELELVGRNFKDFARTYNEDNSTTIHSYCETFGYRKWAKDCGIVANDHLTDDMIKSIYERRDRFDKKYAKYVAHYISKGLYDFYNVGSNLHNCWGPINNVYEQIHNYFNMCDMIGIEPTKDDFYRSFINVYRTYTTKKAEYDSRQIVEHYKKYPALNFETENYIVVIPNSTKDFEYEAQVQQNCVYNLYMPKVIEGKTSVVFIRRKDNIDKPFITCEVNNKGKIIQFLHAFNQSALTTEEKIFEVEYATHLYNNW